MKPAPLLLCAYALSLLCAALVWRSGGGFMASACVFWLGGAVAALFLGLFPIFREPAPRRDDDLDIDAWEADRAADRAVPPAGRAADKT